MAILGFHFSLMLQKGPGFLVFPHHLTVIFSHFSLGRALNLLSFPRGLEHPDNHPLLTLFQSTSWESNPMPIMGSL